MNLGDVVEVKSGGPDMVVARVLDGGRIGCVFWNQAKGAFDEVIVPPEALHKK